MLLYFRSLFPGLAAIRGCCLGWARQASESRSALGGRGTLAWGEPIRELLGCAPNRRVLQSRACFTVGLCVSQWHWNGPVLLLASVLSLWHGPMMAPNGPPSDQIEHWQPGIHGCCRNAKSSHSCCHFKFASVRVAEVPMQPPAGTLLTFDIEGRTLDNESIPLYYDI